MFSFMWATDIHCGRADTYPGDNPAPWLTCVNSANIQFSIATGDLTDLSTAAEFAQYAGIVAALTKPAYSVPGNHDEGAGLDSGGQTADGPATWAEFKAAVSADTHFAVSCQGWRMIGICANIIRAPADEKGYGEIPAAELAWLEGQLQALNGQRAMIFMHEPAYAYAAEYVGWHVHADYGGTEFLALCQTYGVFAVCTGHKHYPLTGYVSNGVNFINAPSRAWQYSSLPTGYVLVDVFDDRIVFSQYSTATKQEAALPIEL